MSVASMPDSSPFFRIAVAETSVVNPDPISMIRRGLKYRTMQ
jgi:hypothetical protein